MVLQKKKKWQDESLYNRLRGQSYYMHISLWKMTHDWDPQGCVIKKNNKNNNCNNKIIIIIIVIIIIIIIIKIIIIIIIIV